MDEIPELQPPTSTPTEWSEVERPLLLQLAGMGWQVLPGDADVPYLTERDDFRRVILYDRLKEAIRRINADDGPVGDLTIDRAIRVLEATGGQSLLEKNKLLTERLIKGVGVDSTEPGATRQRWIRFVEFAPEKLDRNDFLAVNQFRVDPPGGRPCIPDVVLFVNGLPLVVIECKSPGISDPVGEGLDQLLRYSNNRYWVEEDEGIEDLFLFNQLLVVTSFYEAQLGALGGYHEHYQRWKDTTPVAREVVADDLGKEPDKLKPQELLAAGALRPAHLIDVLRNFVLFKTEEGKLIKIVPRYQQFRAVHKAIDRLLTGATRRQDDKDMDRRGGVVWHTQGSGKSITMVYLVRKMRTIPKLRAFKVVVITDREKLETQLRETAAMTGETIRPDDADGRRRTSATETLKSILGEDSPDIVFAMVQKYLERTGEAEVFEYVVPVPPPKRLDDAVAEQEAPKTKKLRQVVRDQEFEVLNESEDILVLIDECHRSHTKTFHANMMKSMPNAAKIGFTGTPIMRCDTANTRSIFGEFIDKYRIGEAEEDEATVRIVYEGRTAEGLVEHTDRLDQVFEDIFREYTEAEKQAIKRKYATDGDVLEAPKLIEAKAADMVRHYVGAIMPNGFKAQVVSVSRLAALRYRDALEAARAELVADVEALDPAILRLTDEELEKQPQTTQFLVGAHRNLDTIRRLEFAAVISHNHNDPLSWRQWSDKTKQDGYIARFKKPLFHDDPEKRDGLAFLCVKSMLTTGFDAPVEQVLYLDRKVIQHELLQTIARVNRKRRGKDRGYIVDYIGVARHLHEALGDYEDETHDPMVDIRDELPKLRDRHKRVLDVFMARGIASIRDVEACVDLLADVKIRAEFINKLRQFLESLGIVMPRPEAMPYLRDAKILGFIARVAAHLYYDNQLNLVGVKHKVKQLIDEYIAAQGIDPKIPPIEIMDVNFADVVRQDGNARIRASRMLHAARHHISIHTAEDPTYYTSLSERLEEILQQLKDNWTELEAALHRFIEEELKRGREEEVEGLDPKVQAPFFGLLKDTVEKETGSELSEDAFRSAVEATVQIVAHVQDEIGKVGFWRDTHSRRQLENWVYRTLRRRRLISQDRVQALAARIVDLAKSRHRFLVA